MPAYKDNVHNTWYCMFYFEDWTGQKKKKKKCGFKTKKEALEWESEFKLTSNANMDMKMVDFIEIYFRDKNGELKDRTKKNKRYMIENRIVPYFGECKMNEITASDIIQWQNEMLQMNFSDSYLRMLQNQMTALFTHASKIYNLKNNPCKKVKKMGRSDSRSLTFWTLEEYEKFLDSIDKDSRYYVLFETLFWTGMRIGELLALTKEDVDLKNNQININKTFYRTGGKDIITSPKTEQSIRVVEIPQFLADELREYLEHVYELPDTERIFPVGQEAVQHKLKYHVEQSGVERIRVHDLRHSHASYLINQGVEPLLIKDRLGHKDIKITLNTYGHLYPNQQKKVANLLDANRTKKES